MTREQLLRAIATTRAIVDRGYKWEPFRTPEDPANPKHLLWMCDEAAGFADDKPAKANRWLGFVQGVIAARGWAGLDEIKRANMPEGETFDGERI